MRESGFADLFGAGEQLPFDHELRRQAATVCDLVVICARKQKRRKVLESSGDMPCRRGGFVPAKKLGYVSEGLWGKVALLRGPHRAFDGKTTRQAEARYFTPIACITQQRL